MQRVLVATDSDEVWTQVEAALASRERSCTNVSSGAEVRSAVEQMDPVAVVVDMQIGNMGGVAVTFDLRQEEGAGRLAQRPVILVLDRTADVFMARRSGADAWLVKPIDPLALSNLVDDLTSGGSIAGSG